MARMTPGRLAYLIAAMLSLSALTAIGVARYPDQQFNLTIDQANAVNDRYRAGDTSSLADCFEGAEDPERPCAVSHFHNFPPRARLIATGIVLAMYFSAMAYRRSLDPRRRIPVAHG